VTRTLNIAVLGGSGFIGSELVAQLAHAGHGVRVLTRKLTAGGHLRVLPDVELTIGNAHDPRVLTRELTGMDVAINLVGILNEPGRNGAGFHHAHAELSAKLMAAAKSQRLIRVLHMSSLGASIDAPSHYLRSKFAAEEFVRAAPDTLDWTIFRPSVVFGRGDSLTNRFAALLRLAHGVLPLAKPDARFAPIFVGDVVSAFVRALPGGATSRQTYELCGPQVLRFEELVRQIAVAANLPCHLIRLPDFVARLQAAVMDFLPGKPFSTDNYRSLSRDSVCSESGCVRLGIKPATLASILPNYLGAARPERRFEGTRRRNSGVWY
jgi:uncharacterized protein YbjT (DUF2867 family)